MDIQCTHLISGTIFFGRAPKSTMHEPLSGIFCGSARTGGEQENHDLKH